MWRAGIGVILAVGVGAMVWQSTSPEGRVDLVIEGGHVVTMDGARTVLADGAVAIDDGVIVAVGPTADVRERFAGDLVIDATGQLVLPGLINTHTHAPMVLYRGLADDLALMDWLNNYIFPAEKATVSPEFVRVGTRLAALEMIESGTTTYADMYYFEEEIARETRAAGLRGVLGQTIIQFPVADAPTAEEGLARAEAFLREFAGDPLIVAAVAPHAPYTLPPDMLSASRELANRYEAPLIIHLAETRDEVATIADAHGVSPAMYLDRLGVWQGRSLGAHGVWLDAADLAMLAGRGVGLSHNPESNMKLASGTAPVPAWLSAGIASGLGTDGAASNNDLDMFEAMRTAALLHKHMSGDPRAMPARTVVEMATIGGAASLGLANRIGSLEAGKAADVITVDLSRAGATPMFDPYSHLVYAAKGTDVRTTVVNGRVLMRAGRPLSLDPRQVREEAAAMAERVRAAVGGTQ